MDTLFPQVERTMAEVDGRNELVFRRSESVCRVCSDDVVDSRWNYCSERCRDIANAVQAMFLWDKVREAVLERDDYTCQKCGVSKSMQWRAYWQTEEMIHDHVGDEGSVLPESAHVESPSSGYFHADHIERVADGGHEFDESNLQTLCKYCHREKTAAENSTPERQPQDVTLADYMDAAE